jgi:two-component system alkaline phosphatase synthesis response regulator PhoP
LALSEKPDVLVVDHLMPQMTGIEVFRELRRLRIHIPVIMMTAADEVYESAPAAGVDHVLEKPFTGADLEAAILKVLAKYAPV